MGSAFRHSSLWLVIETLTYRQHSRQYLDRATTSTMLLRLRMFPSLPALSYAINASDFRLLTLWMRIWDAPIVARYVAALILQEKNAFSPRSRPNAPNTRRNVCVWPLFSSQFPTVEPTVYINGVSSPNSGCIAKRPPVKLRFHNRFIYVGVDISIYALLTGGRS